MTTRSKLTYLGIGILFCIALLIVSKPDRPSVRGMNDRRHAETPTPAIQGKPNEAVKVVEPEVPVATDSASAGIEIQQEGDSIDVVAAEPVYSNLLRQLLDAPTVCLRPEDLKMLSDDEVRRIIAEYEQIEDPSQKRGLTWALGFSGSEAAVQTLVKAMTTEYAGQELSLKQMGDVHLVLPMLGVLAQRSQQAIDFLTTAADPDYWKENQPWLPGSIFAENLHWRLAGGSISALGASGDEAALQTVLARVHAENAEYQSKLAASVVSSVFYHHMQREYGSDFLFNEVLYDGSIMMSAYRVWSHTTEQGREWTGWANELTKFSNAESTVNDLELDAFKSAVSRWR